MANTIIGIDPAYFDNVMARWLKGTVQASGSFETLDYNNDPIFGGLAAVQAAAAALNTRIGQLLAIPGMFVYIMGHSMGAQVVVYWLRVYAPTSTFDRTRMQFIVTGNPERKYGGAARVINRPNFLGRIVQGDYGGNGFLDTVIYNVLDIAWQWEWWCDQPNKTVVTSKAKNNCDQNIHNDYTKVGLSDTDLKTIKTEGPTGNLVYKVKRVYPTKSAKWLWWWPAAQASVDATDRAAIESSYDRFGVTI